MKIKTLIITNNLEEETVATNLIKLVCGSENWKRMLKG